MITTRARAAYLFPLLLHPKLSSLHEESTVCQALALHTQGNLGSSVTTAKWSNKSGITTHGQHTPILVTLTPKDSGWFGIENAPPNITEDIDENFAVARNSHPYPAIGT
jgi:hypothetical protein